MLLNGCMIAPFMNNSTSMKMDTNTPETREKSHASGGMMMKCGGMMKMDHSQKEMSHASGHEEMQSHSKSYLITERYCTQCHEMREKDLYSKEEWKPIIARMKVYMEKTDKLQPDEYETIMIEHYFGADDLK